MKDGRETGSLEEHRNGEPYALKGARTVRKGPERKGLITVPRSQATLRSSSASTVSRVASMQVKIKHISGSEGVWRHGGKELLIERAVVHRPDGRWGGTGQMCGQKHAHPRPCRREGNIQ